MSSDALSITKLCEVSGLARSQIDQWISRGYYVPRTKPENGKARKFSFEEALEICAMAELNRLGLPLSAAQQACTSLHHFGDEDSAILVVWHGPMGLLQTLQRGAPTPEVNKTQYHPDGWPYIHPDANRFYDPSNPFFQHVIVKPHALATLIRDPDKRSVMAVNLSNLAERIEIALNNDEPA